MESNIGKLKNIIDSRSEEKILIEIYTQDCIMRKEVDIGSLMFNEDDDYFEFDEYGSALEISLKNYGFEEICDGDYHFYRENNHIYFYFYI